MYFFLKPMHLINEQLDATLIYSLLYGKYNETKTLLRFYVVRVSLEDCLSSIIYCLYLNEKY
jgi:hypothetical protein